MRLCKANLTVLLAVLALWSMAYCGEGPATAAAPLNIALKVREFNGQARMKECVTTGVPLLPGQCRDVKKLRLLDAAGKEVPAQFRALARWWYKDNSVRWVLVDFRVGLKPFGTKSFTLTDGRTKAVASALKVRQTAEQIIVDTGRAEFVINRKNFNLFERVRIDVNGDGKYEPSEEAISPNPDNGSVVEDTYGLEYYGSAGTVEVKVEESGPVRVALVARGKHRARDGKGYSRGMYGFDMRMHFRAGSSTVRFDANMNNSGAEAIGSPTFEDYSLVTRLNITPTVNPNKGAKDRSSKLAMYAVYGMAPLIDDMKAGQSVVIYQDSNGSETWKINPGIESKNKSELSSFRGYRISLREGGKDRQLAQGDHARGVVEFWGGKFGAVVVPRYFWKQFPKAIEAGHDGKLRIGIFPREYKTVHWLPDAGGAGMEFWIHFFARGMKKGLRGEWPRDNMSRSKWHGLLRDRPWPHVIADSKEPGPLVALCSKGHYAACGALADAGAYVPWKHSRGWHVAVTERRYLMTDYLKGNSFGWQVFGCRWEEYKGHSPWNYEPIGSTDYLYKFINTQHPTWLEWGRRRGMHSRNLRACKVDGTNVWGFKSWGEFRKQNVCEDYAKRAVPKDDELKKYSQGKFARAEWVLPNPAHMNLDECLDLYLLFGDMRALEVSRNAAAVGGAYVGMPDGSYGIHRATGWCFRTLVRYKDLTGDKQCDPYLNKAIENFWKVARKHRSNPGKIRYKNTWFYNVYGRSVVIAYLVTGDERMRDLAIGLTQDRNSKRGHPTLNAFCYDQTGRKVYHSLKADERKIKGAYWGGYFPGCDDWMWNKPRPDKTPPQAVADLKAEALGGGKVKLTWTAPKDDAGAASVYQLKYDDLTITERAKAGSVNFWAAENVKGEPRPAAPGTAETFTASGIKAGTIYFAIKSRDRLNNESDISNVAKLEVK
jgi:PcRGLX-like protein central beta sandwich domain/PcRGLX-like N-terminal RIFT barrel domain